MEMIVILIVRILVIVAISCLCTCCSGRRSTYQESKEYYFEMNEKKMKEFGKVSIPSETFIDILKKK